MLNLFYMTLGPGSSPDPNIYYRTKKVLPRRMRGSISLSVSCGDHQMQLQLHCSSG